MGKFLGTLRVRRNYAHSFYIHDRSHYEFNMWISLWMWDEWVSFFVFRGYLRITHFSEYDDFNWNVTKSLFWFFFYIFILKNLFLFIFVVGLFEIVGWAASCHTTAQRFLVGESRLVQLCTSRFKVSGHMLMTDETITKELQQTSI